MTNHSVYRIETDYVHYLVLAPSEQAAIRCLWETEGSTEEEWKSSNDETNTTISSISSDKLGDIFMYEDEENGPVKAISAVVAEMKLSTDESELICSWEY